MRNVLLAFAAGVVAFSLLYFTNLLGFGESIVPGAIVLIAAYFVLARRTFKQVERVFTQSSQALQAMPPRFDLAVQTLQTAYRFSSQQIGVRTQVDAQIGVLYFLQQNFNDALPYLQRSVGFSHWMAAAMLAVVHYKKKNHDDMKQVLDVVTKRGKKQSLAWSLRAYLLSQIGEREEAQRILGEGLKHTGDDARLKDALLALQNGKKIKMRAYREQWYQLHLERPPADYQQQAIPMRVSRQARRGRW